MSESLDGFIPVFWNLMVDFIYIWITFICLFNMKSTKTLQKTKNVVVFVCMVAYLGDLWRANSMKFQHMKVIDYFSPMCSSVLCLSFSTAQWKDLIVGDVLRIHKDQVIPVRF